MSNFKNSTLVVLNALPAMVLAQMGPHVSIQQISAEQAAKVVNYLGASCVDSYVGHADTAALFDNLLTEAGAKPREFPDGVPMRLIEMRRGNFVPSRKYGEMLLVGAYSGPRLPEGSSTLPEGATIQWLLVSRLYVSGGQDDSVNLLHEAGACAWAGDIY